MPEGTDLAPPAERMQHAVELKPEICTIDCGSMNFGREVVINRIGDLAIGATIARDAGIKPELEVFDMGLVKGTPLFQLCLGIAGGGGASAESMLAMRNMCPPGSEWAAFGISRHDMPMVAQAVILWGQLPGWLGGQLVHE